MDKTTPRSLEVLIFAGSVFLSGALLAYAWLVLAPPEMDTGELKPTAALKVVDASFVEDTYIGATVSLWPEEEEEPWIVAEAEEEIPPVDLPQPVPSVPLPPTPLPVPGPRLEHTGDLPRWGEFPAKKEVPGDAEIM
ncbi:MAG: hypothetical protein JW909_02795 [Planctomycetes bacterium]|nr:hypothetical protein [Planctomycetota bacterium]